MPCLAMDLIVQPRHTMSRRVKVDDGIVRVIRCQTLLCTPNPLVPSLDSASGLPLWLELLGWY